MLIIGIDPSINDIGIACYDTVKNKLQTECFQPTRKGKDKLRNLPSIGMQTARHIFLRFLQGEKEDRWLVLEYPEFQNSARGTAAAIQGDTLNLAYVVGHLCGALKFPTSRIVLTTPSEWKGNLPKDVVEKRCRVAYGGLVDAKKTSHEWEAAMMIQWLLKESGLIR